MHGGRQFLSRRGLAYAVVSTVLIGLVGVAMPATAASDSGTDVCGALPAGNTVWGTSGSPYDLCAAGVSVPAGASLILTGAHIEAQGSGGLTVDGGDVRSFRVNGDDLGGDEGASMDGPLGWAGLVIRGAGTPDPARPSVDLTDVELADGSPDITVDDASVRFDHVLSGRFNAANVGNPGGLVAENDAVVDLEHSGFSQVSGSAISTTTGAVVTMTSTTVSSAGAAGGPAAIDVGAGSTLDGSCSQVGDNPGTGITAALTASTSMVDSIFSQNDGYDIAGAGTVNATHDAWATSGNGVLPRSEPGPYNGDIENPAVVATSGALVDGTPHGTIRLSGAASLSGGAIGPGLLDVEVTTDWRMDTDQPLAVTITGADGTAHYVHGAWSGPRTWQGTYLVDSATADNGANTIRVGGDQAVTCASDGDELETTQPVTVNTEGVAPPSPAVPVTAGGPLITTVAEGDGEGSATDTGMTPTWVRADGSDLMVMDSDHAVLRKVDPSDNTQSVVMGTGSQDETTTVPDQPGEALPGDGLPGPDVSFRSYSPGPIAVAPDGTTYVADGCSVRAVGPQGLVHTVLGDEWAGGFGADGSLATHSHTYVVTGLAVDSSGDLFVGTSNTADVDACALPSGFDPGQPAAPPTIEEIDSTGHLHHVFQWPAAAPESPYSFTSLAFDADGHLVFDSGNDLYQLVGSSADPIAAAAGLDSRDAALTTDGSLLLATEEGLYDVTGGKTQLSPTSAWSVTTLGSTPVLADPVDGNVVAVGAGDDETTVAGDGTAADGASSTLPRPAIGTELSDPGPIVTEPDGSVDVADEAAERILHITAAGTETVIAGAAETTVTPWDPAVDCGEPSGVPATSLRIAITSMTRAPDGSLWFDGAGCFERLDPSTGVVYEESVPSLTPEGQLLSMSDGSILISAENEVLRLHPDGEVTTWASGCGDVRGMALQSDGLLYVTDEGTSTIKAAYEGQPLFSILYGGSHQHYPFFWSGPLGDGQPASAAGFDLPRGLALDSAGDLFIADVGNGLIREVQSDGRIRTVAGGGSGGIGGALFPEQTTFERPQDIAISSTGILYVSDSLTLFNGSGHHLVRAFDVPLGLPTITTNLASGSKTLRGPLHVAVRALAGVSR